MVFNYNSIRYSRRITMNYYMPSKVYIGEHILEKNAQVFEGYSQALIVTGKSSAKKSGALDDLLPILIAKGVEYQIFDEIVQNPTVESVLKAGKTAHDNRADVIIGIGGGSPLDSAKVIAAIATNPDLDEKGLYALDFPSKPLDIILIGTTAGTGSEVTKVAVLTNSEGLKKSVKTDEFYAKAAFGDPRYTMSLNREFTISTGLDALAHCVESYFNNQADDISRGFAKEGTRVLLPELRKLIDPEYELNIKERENLYVGSILGGLAINTTATVFCHNVGYYLTENYQIPHGIACVYFMNDLIEFERKNNPEYAARFFDEIKTDINEFEKLIDALMPENTIKLSELQLQEILPRWQDNRSVKNTYGSMTVSDVEAILRKHFVTE
jgi:alcohol dehydrogenase class IV